MTPDLSKYVITDTTAVQQGIGDNHILAPVGFFNNGEGRNGEKRNPSEGGYKNTE